MIKRKELFKIYNLKSWKESRFQIFLSIMAIVIAVAILVSLKLILALNASYTIINAKSVNEGDINIAMSLPNISQEQLNKLNELSDKGKIHYTTTYKVQNNFTNGDITNIIEVKFIDSNYSYINKKVASHVEKLGKHKVLINRALADKFQLKIGDTINLSIRGVSNDDSKFIIGDIIENTNVIDENIIGVVILQKYDLQPPENVKKENFVTNINIAIDENYKLNDILNDLEKSFNNGTQFNTYEDGLRVNKNVLDQESKASNFIQMIVIVITGIGISFTNLLLILKRKKDYVLLSIYGMKEDTLRDIILYEVFIICVIGTIIGTCLSFIIIGIVEKNILVDMSILTLIKVSMLPLLTTLAFIIIQTIIFTILPITISKQINPNSILRKEVKKIGFDENYISPIFKMVVLITICFSIYIGSLKTGIIYVCIMLVFISILYTLAIIGIHAVVKMKPSKNKFLLLALRNINRQKNSFAFCSTALIISLILCGIIINLGQTIIPSIISQIADDSGYNVAIIENPNDKENENTENILCKESSVSKFIKTINTSGKFKSVKGKNLEEFIKDQKLDYKLISERESFYNNNFGIQALDISKNMVNYKMSEGRWFNSSDTNKNYVVLGNNFYNCGLNINDEISLDIQGKTYKFIVIGVCTRSNFRENSQIYVDINVFNSNSIAGDNIRYLIQCNTANQKALELRLTKNLKNSLVLDERERFNEVNLYIQKLTYVFVYICFMSVFSALCLIGNILMIINFERLNEFLILNVVGAKNKDIMHICIIEGGVVGSISGLVGCLISEWLSNIVVTGGFSCKYTPNYRIDLAMIFATIILMVGSSILVINNMKVEKHIGLLRMD